MNKKNNIPFILFTGKGREEVVIKALNLGADGYINKQVNPETVYGELQHLIITSFEKRNTQKMLWQSEERFKKLINNSKDAIMLTQADGVILYLSPACKNVLGYEPSELIGKIPWIIYPDDLGRVQNVFQSALSRKVSETLEYRILTKQGETKWISHAFSQIWENGILKQIVSNLTDISERKKAEEAIVQSESHYRLLADNIRDVIWMMDLEGHFTYVSPSAIQLSGYTPEEVLKQSIAEVLTPKSARIVLEDLQSFSETGALPSSYYELEQRCKDGSTVWIEINFTVLRNKDYEPESFLGVTRNITERKRAEDNIKSLAKFPNENPSAVFRIDKNGFLLFANPQSKKILDSLKIKKGYPFPERWRKTIIESLESKNQLHLEEKVNERLFSFSLVPIVFEGYVNVYGSDITERKKVEIDLQKNEVKLRAILDATPFPVALVDTDDDKITFWSKSALKLFGHVASTRKEWYEIAYPDPIYREFVINQWKLALEKARLTGQWVNTGEYNVTCRDGSVCTCELYATFLAEMLIVTFNDITAHKKAEETLRESEEKYRKMFEGALDAIFLADAETGTLIDCNSVALELVGREKSEIIGQHQRILHPINELEGDETRSFKQHQMQDGVLETQIITKKREIKDVSIRSNHIMLGGRKVLQGIFRDTTKRTIAQRALLLSEGKYRETTQNANIGIVAYQPDGKITILNPRMQKMTGYTIKEIPNLNLWFKKALPG